ncbi:hypothetical protein KT99_14144 [Shewanella benthica KT99]|uniref:Uncharacterized protein n=1 Tax=Shewanella benthica KT99 TaxID=314608 RepID=A9EI56_9GAMM|nr:hypothetical protein KT99_14144 [Shewanella benthica KT99]
MMHLNLEFGVQGALEVNGVDYTVWQLIIVILQLEYFVGCFTINMLTQGNG